MQKLCEKMKGVSEEIKDLCDVRVCEPEDLDKVYMVIQDDDFDDDEDCAKLERLASEWMSLHTVKWVIENGGHQMAKV